MLALLWLFLLMVSSLLTCVYAVSHRKAKRPADYREDGDVGLERQRVVTGDANNDLLTLYNLTKVNDRLFQLGSS